jgi:hypothetical protein
VDAEATHDDAQPVHHCVAHWPDHNGDEYRSQDFNCNDYDVDSGAGHGIFLGIRFWPIVELRHHSSEASQCIYSAGLEA